MHSVLWPWRTKRHLVLRIGFSLSNEEEPCYSVGEYPSCCAKPPKRFSASPCFCSLARRRDSHKRRSRNAVASPNTTFTQRRKPKRQPSMGSANRQMTESVGGHEETFQRAWINVAEQRSEYIPYDNT